MCKLTGCNLTGCACGGEAASPLANCVREAPTLPPLPNGASDEGDDVRDACLDVISAASRLMEIMDVSPDEEGEEWRIMCRYIDVQSAVADLTKAVVLYNEPEDGGEPY